MRHLLAELADGRGEASDAVSAPAVPDASAALDVPFTSSTRLCSGAEVIELASQVGLTGRLEEVGSMARCSLRLTPDTSGASRSYLGGSTVLGGAETWPTWEDEPLALVAHIDLVEAHVSSGGAVPLPTGGSLRLFFDARRAPSGTRHHHIGAVRATVHEAAATGGPVGGGVRVSIAGEIVLPRVWSQPVELLGLDADERRAWQLLRRRLAHLQGVEDSEGPPARIDRLLGYPDNRRGDMPLMAAMRAAGFDLSRVAAGSHPARVGHEADALRWRLLFQIEARDLFGWSWPNAPHRLYVWVHEDALSIGDLSAAQAFAL